LGRLAVVLIVLLTCPVLTFVHEVKCIEFNEPIFINADGSINPPTAPIQLNGSIYTLTGNITTNATAIIVQKSNITLEGADYTVRGGGVLADRSGISLVGIDHVTIKNMRITNFSWGISLDLSSNSNTISDNNIANNFDGVHLDSSSTNNTVSNNNINANEHCGIDIWYSDNNVISGNNITNSHEGIHTDYSSNNTIYHNNFINNTIQAYGTYFSNSWDNGYPSGGNYWARYSSFDLYQGVYQNETGSDGMADTPYVINPNNTDHYPWMMLRTSSSMPPVAVIEIDAPTPLKVDDIVVFNAARSVCGWNGTHASPIKEYIWNFGDGNTTSTDEKAIAHSYGNATEWYSRVWLTVVDLDGKNSSTFTWIIVVMPTSISISTTSPSSFIGFAVGINGRLQDIHGLGLINETVLLSYTFSGVTTWFPITSSVTDDSGRYSAQWIPTATGYFTIRVEWSGNYSLMGGTYLHLATNDTVTLCTVPFENLYIFAVESSSTISDLTFDSNSHRLSFVADGENGTAGYAKVTIAKNLAPDITKLKVHLDQTEYEYAIINMTDSWVVLFSYNHSIHQIEIDLGQTPIPEFPSFLIVTLFTTAIVLAVIVHNRKHLRNS